METKRKRTELSLKKRLHERTKRAQEPFKGTLGSYRTNSQSEGEADNSSDEREKKSPNLKEHLREQVESKKGPFLGSFGNRIELR